MRAPDLFEVVIAIGAAVTVIGAIIGILWRVTRGNPEANRLDALKEELSRESSSSSSASSVAPGAGRR